MRPRYRRSRDREDYLEAIDEAKQNVRIARPENHDALDELDDLEDRDPDSLFPPDED